MPTLFCRPRAFFLCIATIFYFLFFFFFSFFFFFFSCFFSFFAFFFFFFYFLTPGYCLSRPVFYISSVPICSSSPSTPLSTFHQPLPTPPYFATKNPPTSPSLNSPAFKSLSVDTINPGTHNKLSKLSFPLD